MRDFESSILRTWSGIFAGHIEDARFEWEGPMGRAFSLWVLLWWGFLPILPRIGRLEARRP